MEEKEFVEFLSKLPSTREGTEEFTEQFYESNEFKKIVEIINDGTYWDMQRNLSEEEKEICVNKIFDYQYYILIAGDRCWDLMLEEYADNLRLEKFADEANSYLDSIDNEEIKKSIIEKNNGFLHYCERNIEVIKEVINNPETRIEMYSECIKYGYTHEGDCDDLESICFDDDIDVWRKVLENNPDNQTLKVCCSELEIDMSYFDEDFFISGKCNDIVPRLELCQEYYNNAKDKKEPDVDLIGKYIELREEKIKENNEKIEDKKETVEQLNWKAKLAEQESILSAQETEIADLDRQIADLTKEQK